MDRNKSMLNQGRLEVICGPMFSGKTEELIKRLRRAKIAFQNVVAFKPLIDDRYDLNDVVSHSEQRVNCVAVADTDQMRSQVFKILDEVDVIGIDEVQFFDDKILGLVDYFIDKGKRVIIAGLDLDYLGKPFGPVPYLLSRADMVSKETAVCMVCGRPANMTQRIHPDAASLTEQETRGTLSENPIDVGAATSYEARCRLHHKSQWDRPSKLRSGRLFTHLDY